VTYQTAAAVQPVANITQSFCYRPELAVNPRSRAALRFGLAAIALTALPAAVRGQDAAEMARKLQDPLANISAVMTDNDVLFKTGVGGADETSYSFQIQPVQAFSFDEAGFNFIARAVVPILGLAPTAQKPPGIGEPLPPGDALTWGLSDITSQFFFSPKSSSAWKWGAGPMISWRSRTTSDLAGPGWGAGPVGVLVGGFGENVSFALITGQLWNFDGDFSTTLLHPMVMYNFPNAEGWAIGYNIATSYNWKAKDSSNALSFPIGFTVGKTIALAGGYGLDLSTGPYWNVARPEGAAEFQLKWGVTMLFP